MKGLIFFFIFPWILPPRAASLLQFFLSFEVSAAIGHVLAFISHADESSDLENLPCNHRLHPGKGSRRAPKRATDEAVCKVAGAQCRYFETATALSGIGATPAAGAAGQSRSQHVESPAEPATRSFYTPSGAAQLPSQRRVQQLPVRKRRTSMPRPCPVALRKSNNLVTIEMPTKLPVPWQSIQQSAFKPCTSA